MTFATTSPPNCGPRSGYANPASVFTATELPVAAIALTALAIIVKVKDNVRALKVIHGMILRRPGAARRATLAFDAGWLGPLPWMIASGAGLYVVYTPFNAMLFDRLVAAGGEVANAGFLIYVADSAGYAGSCALLLWRNFGLTQRRVADRVPISRPTRLSVVGIVLIAASLLYFSMRTRDISQ